MANQYDSTKRTIGDLLSMTTPPIRVPDWQRSYSWTTTEVEAFWLDIRAFDDRYPALAIQSQEYFLGSVVLVLGPGSHLLLDGQQRAATATILLSVIRDHVRQYREQAATRITQRYLRDYDDAADSYTYKLTLNQYDRDFFRQLIQEERDAQSPAPARTLQSHELIALAKEYFERQFVEHSQTLGGGEAAFRWALRTQKVLTDHVSVVVVMSEDEDNAATVFETLNDRGVGLSTPDLLRNLIIRRARDEDRDEIIDCWQEVLEVAEDAKVEDFLRHHWLSRNGDVKTRRLYREIKEHVEVNDVDSLAFSRELRGSVARYRDLVNARHDNASIADLLKDIDELGAKALLPAALSAVEEGNENDVQELLSALVVFFVRHNLIGNLENSQLETVVYRLAKQLRDDHDSTAVVEALRNAAPTDARFQSQFEVVSIGRQRSARHVLRRLEIDRRTTEELEVGPPTKVHLEHIYPQNPQGGRGPRHVSIVNRLGNLTLLSSRLNQAIKNAPFDEKKPRYAESEILITRELTNWDDWDEDKIDERQTALAEAVPRIWAFPDSP